MASTPGKFVAPKKATFSSYFSKQKTLTYPDSPLPRTSLHTSIVRCLSWSPLGNLIATGVGVSNPTLRIWNPERTNIKFSTELRGHSSTVDKVAWNPEREAELASAGADGTVRFWDVRSKGCVGVVKVGSGSAEEILNVAWRPDGGEVVVGRKDDYLVRIDRSTLTEVSRQRQSTQTNQIAFSWSGRELLCCSGEGNIRILDYPTLDELYTIPNHASSCRSIEVAPSGAYIAVGGSDALITLVDTTDWVCKRTFDRCQGSVASVSFSCDGAYLIGGSDEGHGIEIAHVESGEYVHRIETGNTVPVVQWSPKDYSIAYAPSDGSEKLSLKVVGMFGSSR
ncbi:WD40 repeat-like protein [Tothia fuscella]|uniref:WD40 repeat-like protein n=1 Tax=Tothia fuscella TaxID=1048955 RepID=A0A9P4NP80_9PEZI|nr:WD40 repeat-like protein [Tothia fuscella]